MPGLFTDTTPSEDESPSAVSRDEQKLRPLNFSANNTTIYASKARNGRSTKTEQKSKRHSSCGRESYLPVVGLEAHKHTFEDCQKTSSKSTPPDEIGDVTFISEQQSSSGAVVESLPQGRPIQGTIARRDDIQAGIRLQANQTVLRSPDPSQEQDSSRQQTKSSSRSDDALPRPEQATRRGKRTSPQTNESSAPEQPQRVDAEQLDDDEDEGSNSSDDKPSTEVSANDGAQKATAFHNKLRLTLERNLAEQDSEGFVYIFVDPTRPQYLKIGHSIEPCQRAKSIKSKCRLKLELEEVMKVWVNCKKKTESLVQDYLSDLCYKHCCICNRKHKEWFEIPRESAIAALIKWQTFMDTEKPYDLGTGQLRPFFRDWIKKQDPFFSGGEGEATREHWDRILAITWIDRFRFKFNVVWDLFWRFYWQVNTMFAWTVTFLVVRHPLTFLLLGVSVVGTFICISNGHNQPRRRLRTPRKVSWK